MVKACLKKIVCLNYVRKEVAKRTKALTEAKRAVELERDSAMAIADSFESERDTALRQLREQKTGEQHRISMAVSRATAEKDKTIRLLQSALKASRHILSLFADMLIQASHRCDYPFRYGAAQVRLFPLRSR